MKQISRDSRSAFQEIPRPPHPFPLIQTEWSLLLSKPPSTDPSLIEAEYKNEILVYDGDIVF
jgi:hypothetical protein